jgi:hypothetical protein
MSILTILIILFFGFSLGLGFVVMPIMISKKCRKIFMDDLKDFDEKYYG